MTQPGPAEELQEFCDITAGWADMAHAVQPGAVQPGLAASLGEMEDLLQDMGLWLNGMGRLAVTEGGTTHGSAAQQGHRRGQGQGQQSRGERGWGPPDEFLEGLGVHLLAHAQAAGWEATEEMVRAGLGRLRGLRMGGAAAPTRPVAAAAAGGVRPAAAGATRQAAAAAGSTAVGAARVAGGRARAVQPHGPLMAPLSADAAQGAPAVSLCAGPPYRGASTGGTTPIPTPAPGHVSESTSLRRRLLNTQQGPVTDASDTSRRPRVAQPAPGHGPGATGPADAATAVDAHAVGTGVGQPVGVLTPGEQGAMDAAAGAKSWGAGFLGRRWPVGRQGAAPAEGAPAAAAGAAAEGAGAEVARAGVLGRRVKAAAAAVGLLCGEPPGEQEARALRLRVVAWNEAFARIMWVKCFEWRGLVLGDVLGWRQGDGSLLCWGCV